MIRFYFFLLLLVVGFFLLRALFRNVFKSPFWQTLLTFIHPQDADTTKTEQYAFKGKMTEVEAYEVLGLKQGASKQDIIAAHRKLMQKNHPDHGGSDYLAAKINLAKHTLLKNHR
ncbi:hypothetical protein DOJK_00932 [Patescibacteria group bacterium]|nr:hypothetical protein DOJK_00932 [Patescibacteria group bacterium]